MELNRRRQEDRALRSLPVSAEPLCFPHAQQIARVVRQLQGHGAEEVCLITSCEPEKLDATQWLRFNRQAWGIEAGLHQRLDVSHNDDRCRVRNPNAMMLFALMRRLANSLMVEWQGQFPTPEHKTTADFQSHFSADHHQRGIRFLTSKHPTLKVPP